MSFLGGGQDHFAWYREHGARILTSTVAHYCYLSARWLPPFHDYRYRVVWSEIEHVNHVHEIRHPSVRACLKYLEFDQMDQGVEIHHTGDLPARSGLGSSSAFTVGLLAALYALKGAHMSKVELARRAIHVEQELLQEAVGIQDQIECAHGDLRLVTIERDGTYSASPLALPLARVLELERHLMLFYTGVQRFSSDVAGQQVAAISNGSTELSAMRALVDDAVAALTGSGPLRVFGEILHEGWMHKRVMPGASNGLLDKIYQDAIGAGASGGKLLGAGGGGFFLFVVEPRQQAAIRDALQECVYVPFQFDHHGCQIIFSEPDRREALAQVGVPPSLRRALV